MPIYPAHLADPERFLSGEIKLKAVRDVTCLEGMNIVTSRKYNELTKVIIAWCLVIANPKAFDFTLKKGELVGPIKPTLRALFPEEWGLHNTAYHARLYGIAKCDENERALTLPEHMIELVRKHIDNPDGGIARYCREHKLEVPTELDPEVAAAALAKKPSKEERSAKEAELQRQRAERRARLKTDILVSFLNGERELNEMQLHRLDPNKKKFIRQESSRDVSKTNKALVAWALIIACPEHFGFAVENGRLVGYLTALTQIFRYEDDVLAASVKAGLHQRIKGSHQMTVSLPAKVIELVRKHIGNPDGGIARYCREHKLEVPTELRPEVAEAALAEEPKPEQPTAMASTSPKQDESPALAPDTDPVISEAAEELRAQLRKVHMPEVLAALKRIL